MKKPPKSFSQFRRLIATAIKDCGHKKAYGIVMTYAEDSGFITPFVRAWEVIDMHVVASDYGAEQWWTACADIVFAMLDEFAAEFNDPTNWAVGGEPVAGSQTQGQYDPKLDPTIFGRCVFEELLAASRDA